MWVDTLIFKDAETLLEVRETDWEISTKRIRRHEQEICSTAVYANWRLAKIPRQAQSLEEEYADKAAPVNSNRGKLRPTLLSKKNMRRGSTPNISIIYKSDKTCSFAIVNF